MTYWYLASPYSNYPKGIDYAHVKACQAVAEFVEAGVPVYSPIAHTHPVAMIGCIDPHNHDFWLPIDKPMMDAASGLIVLMLDGWLTSRGVAYETEVFAAAGKPIVYMTPGKVPDEVKP